MPRAPESDAARARRRARIRRGWPAHLATWAIRLGVLPLLALPAPISLWVGRRFGELVWHLAPARRRIARENLRIAFGEGLSARERDRIGRESVRRFAMTLVEGLLLPRWIRTGRLEGLVRETPGFAAATARHEAGGAIIFFSGHFGAWEVGARHLVRRGWRLGVPYRSTKNEVLQEWIVRTRAIAGPEQFHRRGALRAMMRLLRDGAAVGMFIDQHERSGILVDFFGRPAATVPTVGLLAERTGAEVWFQMARRVIPGRAYDFVLDGPFAIPAGGSEEDRIRAWTQVATAHVEARVREDPADWLWIHRRWRPTAAERDAVPLSATSGAAPAASTAAEAIDTMPRARRARR
jgi:KDO2-lipid IV(A) lauroyltransferase